MHKIFTPCGKGIAALILSALWLAGAPCAASAFTNVFPAAQGVEHIGKTLIINTVYEDTLLDIARDFDLGYNEIIAANPGVDPWIPGEGTSVVIPSHWLLPGPARRGLVLNLAEMRLFYYFRDGGEDLVVTYPVGVGREGMFTPTGVYSITGKEKDPTWYPPASIRAEHPDLPAAVPPGPKNPLGEYKIKMTLPGYLLHGTHKPWGVGRRVSHGCIRLYPEDIERLYRFVRAGDRVEIVYKPVKLGLVDGRLMAEVHGDYLGESDIFAEAVRDAGSRGLSRLLDIDKLKKAVEEKRGYPVDVNVDPEAPPSNTPSAE